jgi:anti-sigma-K factor RskA
MTPLWRTLSAALALVAGFALPLFAVSVFLGVKHHGAPAIVGLLALVASLTLVVLFARGRLRF